MVSLSVDVLILIGLTAIAAFFGTFALRVHNHLASGAFYLTLLGIVAILPGYGFHLAMRGFVAVTALGSLVGIALAVKYVMKEYMIIWIVDTIALLVGLVITFDIDYAVFLVLGGIATMGGIMAMEAKEIMHAVYYLAITFLSLVGVYALLAAEYLMVVQLLVYVGAVIILMAFAIMLTRRTILATDHA